MCIYIYDDDVCEHRIFRCFFFFVFLLFPNPFVYNNITCNVYTASLDQILYDTIQDVHKNVFIAFVYRFETYVLLAWIVFILFNSLDIIFVCLLYRLYYRVTWHIPVEHILLTKLYFHYIQLFIIRIHDMILYHWVEVFNKKNKLKK